GVTPHEVVDADTERHGQSHPDGTPDGRLGGAHLMRFFVENEQVQGEHRQNEGVEADPQPDVIHVLAAPGHAHRSRAGAPGSVARVTAAKQKKARPSHTGWSPLVRRSRLSPTGTPPNRAPLAQS